MLYIKNILYFLTRNTVVQIINLYNNPISTLITRLHEHMIYNSKQHINLIHQIYMCICILHTNYIGS